MLSEILKQETLSAHQELEKKLVAKMREMKSLDDYARLLQLFFAFFGGLEKLIEPYIDEGILPDYPERRKTAAIVADLELLNSAIPATADELPEVTGTAQALGALYVMEGSTLGGQHIRKMLARQLRTEEGYAA